MTGRLIAAEAQLVAWAEGGVDATPPRCGRLTGAGGGMLQATGLDDPLGTLCGIGDDNSLLAELAGFRGGTALLMPHGPAHDLRPGLPVVPLGKATAIRYGESMLGRMIDGLGQPIDSGPPLADLRPFTSAVNPGPGIRDRIVDRLETGIRVIDALMTLGRGQRVGIMSGSGVGKSTLLRMIARHAAVDVVVIALIGERRREIADFAAAMADDGSDRRAVIVAVPGGDAAILRSHGARRARAIADGFAGTGRSVLLILDSLTRVAHARREVGTALGEPPTLRGYPPSALAEIVRLIDRPAPPAGDVTSIYTILADGDDLDDPVVDTARGILDGHIILSRALAESGLYPPIDVPRSLSRVMGDLVAEKQMFLARRARADWQLAEEAHGLQIMGAYAPGADPATDAALARRAALRALVAQGPDPVSHGEAVAGLEAIYA